MNDQNNTTENNFTQNPNITVDNTLSAQNSNTPSSKKILIAKIILVIAIILFILSSYILIDTMIIKSKQSDYGGAFNFIFVLVIFAPLEIICSSLYIVFTKKSKIWLFLTIIFPIIIKFIIMGFATS